MLNRIYIAGKVTGNKHWKEDFLEAEKKLREQFPHSVIVNPLFISDDSKSWKENMVECIKMLVTCEAIYLIRGWNKSKGATLELSIARGLDLVVLRGYKNLEHSCEWCRHQGKSEHEEPCRSCINNATDRWEEV